MTRSNPKWPIAKGQDNSYVHIGNAEHGVAYRCPQCGGPFIARQGNVKAWHFAHHPGAVCTGEGARHDITKHTIAAILATVNELPLVCDCQRLPAGLLPVVFTSIDVEHVVNDYRVDVTCEVEEQRLCIEVVDSNPVSDMKREALGDSLVEVDISRKSNEAIFQGDWIRHTLLTQLGKAVPLLIGRYMFVHVWSSRCWKCKKELTVATVCGDMWSDVLPSAVLATLHAYVDVEFRSTSAVRDGYWANICRNCQAVQGDWYLHDEMLEVLVVEGEDAIRTIAVPLETKQDGMIRGHHA